MTANQLYRESKSELSFKEWLKDNQKQGFLENHEKMFNMVDGETDEKPSVTTQKAKKSLGLFGVVGIVGLGLLLYGLSNSSSN